MKKIPTLFKRDPEDMKRVLPEVNPECQWVLDGEGIATRKYDGTCVMFDGTNWWARREVKPGKTPPPNFRAEQRDENTGKTVGWEPIEQSPFRGAFGEANAVHPTEPGTYELCGPKVNGNPEGYTLHRLVRHADAERIIDAAAWRDDYQSLRDLVTDLGVNAGWEGIVWHHPDGRMAKLKARDFPTPAETTEAGQ